MKTYKLYLVTLLITSLALACADTQNNQSKESNLKDAFKDDFTIGTALSASQINQEDPATDVLIKKHFNVLTPENIMKSMFMQPEWGKFDFTMGDKLIDYANKNNMKVVGHALIWHSQLPPYVHKITQKDSLKSFFTNHINTVAKHYDNKVFAWDVVNEALNEDGTIRQSIFQRLLGDDFVTEAFRLAEKATPNSELYYNDYNIEQPSKRAGAIRLIKQIQAEGIRIDGVGIQGHWHLGKVPFEEIEKSILEYAALGLKVMFTELDIEVLRRDFNGAEISQSMQQNSDPTLNPYTAGLPEEIQKKLADDYAKLFQLFLKHKDKIERVTFWGVNDQQSWLNGWPVPGRTNYPLLFDRNNQPKPAYYSVMALKDIKP